MLAGVPGAPAAADPWVPLARRGAVQSRTDETKVGEPMRSSLTIAVLAVVSFAAAACSGDDTQASPTPVTSSAVPSGATGNTGTIIDPSGSLPPTSSPGITGSVTQGNATMTLSGAASGTVTLSTLSSPAIWSPPPGSMALLWSGPAKQAFGLGGASFVGQRSTSSALSLSFTVLVGGAAVAFTSTSGECIITITTAQTNSVAASYQCTGVPNDDASIVINAQGSFSATG